MARRVFVVAVWCLLGAGAASGQEIAGAGRIEGGIFPAGAIFFEEAGDSAEPGFGEYTFGGWGGYNFNQWFGVAGELGVGVAKRKDISFARGQFTDARTPYLAAYSANGVWHPRGNDRAIAPYATAGIGGLTLYQTSGTQILGLNSNQTFLTGNVGGGLKWYLDRSWGLQVDYRLLAVKGKDDASPFFGLNRSRYGHRVAWNFLVTR